eukprot:7729856-Alexandrium_andersonii.AAC.1
MRQRIRSSASPNANSWALVLTSTDGVASCCRTARAPQLSELTDTGVLRVKRRRQARRLTNTARAPQ